MDPQRIWAIGLGLMLASAGGSDILFSDFWAGVLWGVGAATVIFSELRMSNSASREG